MVRTYSELIRHSSFEDRVQYALLRGHLGDDTFGFDRYLNQNFYRSNEWRAFRNKIIARDNGCDLGHPDYPIRDWVVNKGVLVRPKVIIHHLNPLTKEDILHSTDALFDPENVICVSLFTHNIIHYGDPNSLPKPYVERSPNDTCPWKKGVV